jgi:hypothetical protein
MAKIRSKQLADFVLSYSASTASTDILSAAAVSIEISNAGTALTGGVNASIDSLEGNVSALTSADTSINTRIGLAETLNTAQDASIDSLEGNVSALTSADTSINTRIGLAETLNTEQTASIDSLEFRVSDADAAISTAVAAYESADGSINTRVGLAESVNAIQSTAISTAVANDVLHVASIDSLEAAIMQDFDMVEEILPGISAAATVPTPYTLIGAVQDNDPALVQVFVNGHKVKCTLAVGNQATVVAPYDIDGTDVVTFLFQQE